MLIVFFSCILYFFIYAQHQYLTSKFIYDIKKDVFQHIHQCRAEYLTDLSSGDLMTTLQACTSECLHFMIRNVIHFTNGILKYSKWINYWTSRALVIPKIKDDFFMRFGLYFLGGLLIIRGDIHIGDLLVFASYY